MAFSRRNHYEIRRNYRLRKQQLPVSRERPEVRRCILFQFINSQADAFHHRNHLIAVVACQLGNGICRLFCSIFVLQSFRFSKQTGKLLRLAVELTAKTGKRGYQHFLRLGNIASQEFIFRAGRFSQFPAIAADCRNDLLMDHIR